MQASTERDLARQERKQEIERYEGIVKDLTSAELEAAKAAGVTMYFTGTRHFFH